MLKLKFSSNNKLLLYLITLILILLFKNNTLNIIIILLINIIMLYLYKLTKIKLILFIISMIIISLLPIILTNEQQLLYNFNNWGISLKSITLSIKLFYQMLACSMCSILLISNMKIYDLINTLHRIHLPSLLLNLIELSYLMIALLYKRSQKIYQAQRSRLGYLNYKSKLVCFGLLLSSLFKLSLHEIKIQEQGLTSRGYHNQLHYYEKQEASNSFTLIFSLIYLTILIMIGVNL